jgi:hypothetical protein
MMKTSCRLQIPFKKWGEGIQAFTATECYKVFLGNQLCQYEMHLQQFGNCFCWRHQEVIGDAFWSWPWNLAIVYFNERIINKLPLDPKKSTVNIMIQNTSMLRNTDYGLSRMDNRLIRLTVLLLAQPQKKNRTGCISIHTFLHIYNRELCQPSHQFLMMEAETISEMLKMHFILIWLITWDDFITK